MIREKQMSAASGWLALAFFLPLLVLLVALIILEARQGPDTSLWVIIDLQLRHRRRRRLPGRPVRREPERRTGPAVVRQLRRHGQAPGAAVGEPVLHQEADLAPHAELREQPAEGERHRGQSDRDRRRRRLAGGGDGGGRASRWTTTRTSSHVQSESALRNLATQLPLRRARRRADRRCAARRQRLPSTCKTEIQERLSKAGVEVIEARISHLAYAPEIAAAMLQRQQAGAIIAARQRIVEGAVGMVEMALERMSQKDIVRARRGAEGARWSATCWSCSAASARRSR